MGDFLRRLRLFEKGRTGVITKRIPVVTRSFLIKVRSGVVTGDVIGLDIFFVFVLSLTKMLISF